MSECKTPCIYHDGLCINPACPSGLRARISELEAQNARLRLACEQYVPNIDAWLSVVDAARNQEQQT